MRASVNVWDVVTILVPFAMVGIAFAVLMFMTYEMTAQMADTFIPHKVASMLGHILTGSQECLLYNATVYKVKGVIDYNKTSKFVDSYPDSQPDCAKMPCWNWRARITDFNTTDTYSFGDDSTDDEAWKNVEKTLTIPVLIKSDDYKHLGKLRIEVKKKSNEDCNKDVNAALVELAAVSPDMVLTVGGS